MESSKTVLKQNLQQTKILVSREQFETDLCLYQIALFVGKAFETH